MGFRVLIAALCLGLGTPGLADPQWSAADIDASRVVHDTAPATDTPSPSAKQSNLLLAEETEGAYLTLLDGDTFDLLTRIETSIALQAEPAVSPDGRHLFRLSSDGWVQKIDLWSLREVGRVRAGLTSRDIALSHDGKWLAVANAVPETLTLLVADDLSVAEIHPIEDKHGTPSGVIAVATRRAQESFVLTLSDVTEIWEVFYGPNPPFYGFVHDYRIEGPPDETEAFPMRRITVPERLGNFQFDPSFEYVMAAAQDRAGVVVVDLVIGHKIADLGLPGAPDWTSAVSWQQGDQGLTVVPAVAGDGLSVINMAEWQVIRQIATDGPGVAVQSHDTLPTIWAAAGDAVQVIDKQSLDVLETLRPAPGAWISDMSLTRDGAHAVIAFEEGGAVVLATKTFELIKRLDMPKTAQIHSISR